MYAFRRVHNGRLQSTTTGKARHGSLWVCWLGRLHVHDRSHVSVSLAIGLMLVNGWEIVRWQHRSDVAATARHRMALGVFLLGCRALGSCLCWLQRSLVCQQKGSCLWAGVLNPLLETV